MYSARRYDIGLREERDLAYERLKRICQSGLVSITDFRRVPRLLQLQVTAGKATALRIWLATAACDWYGMLGLGTTR